MKKVTALALCMWVSTTIISFMSCDNDTDDIDYNYVRPTAIVTVKPNLDNSSFYLQLNDSITLTPSNMKTSPFGKKEVRAFINYTVAANETSAHQGQPITINWMDSILTKQSAKNYGEKNDSAYGTDPVEIVKGWETGAEDGYLTLRFRTKWGYSRAHAVNLVHRTDANEPYLLEFYQDANGDVNGNWGDGIVAFYIDSLFQTDGKPIEITLRWKSYTGEKTTTFKYKSRKPVTE